MTFEAFKWIVVALSLWGTVLNVRHDRRCFYIWGVSNVAWVVIDVVHGVWSQATLQGIYAGLSVYGIVAWKKREER
jgi:nicotinamide riboside transporter PnuC